MVTILTPVRPSTEPLYMSHTGADPTGNEDATPFFNRHRNNLRPLVIDGTYRISEPGSVADPYSFGKGGLNLIGANGVIEGYGGWGFHVFGGSVNLSGELTFQDFREASRVGPGTDWQGKGARGAVIGIGEYSASNPESLAADRNTPAFVDYLRIGPGVRFLRSRMGITCSGATRKSLTADISNTILRAFIFGLETDDVACPLIFTGAALRSGTVSHSTFRRCVGGFQEVGAVRIGPDDVPIAAERDALREFSKYSGFSINNCLVDGVIQKVTSGDSSPGNQFSSIGFICNGWVVNMSNNKALNVTGVNRDCEAYYSKAVYGNYTGNVAYNAGSGEAAFAAKGYDPDLANDAGIRGLGIGRGGLFANNLAVFDEYHYAHTGHSKVSGPAELELWRNGFTVNCGSFTSVHGNTCIGSNGYAFLIDTDDTLYPTKTDTRIERNEAINHRGYAACFLADGKFERTRVRDNHWQFAADVEPRRYAYRDNKWYPVDYVTGIETGSLTEGLVDVDLGGNTTTLLRRDQSHYAYGVVVRAKQAAEVKDLVLDDNKIQGEGCYRTATVRIAIPDLSELQPDAKISARGLRNSYKSLPVPVGLDEFSGSAALLLDADAASLPLGLSMSGEVLLDDVQRGDSESTKIWEVPLVAPQTLYLVIDWTAVRLSPTPSATYTAGGRYEVVLMRGLAPGSFIAANPQPRDPANTTDVTDPYNLIAYGDPNASPPIIASPSFTATSAEQDATNQTRLLAAVRPWVTGHTHGAGSLTSTGGVTGRTGSPSALILPTGVTWPTAPTGDVTKRPPPAGELVYAAPRDQPAPDHGIVAETMPTLSDAHFEEAVGYPRIFARTERRFNKNGKEFFVSTIRFAPVISGKWQFTGSIHT